MKNTMKKALTLFLTLAMVASTFAIAVSAGTMETQTQTVTITEDFSKATTTDNGYSVTESGWRGKNATGNGSISMGGNQSQNLVYTFDTSAASTGIVFAPNDIKGMDSYTISGEFKATGFSSAAGYYRVFVFPNDANYGSDNVCVDGRAGDTFTTYMGGVDSGLVASSLPKNDTIGFKCVRNGTSFSVTFYEKDTPSNTVTLTRTVPAVAATTLPGLRFQAGGASPAGTTVEVDNLKIEYSYEETVFVPDEIIPDGWKAIKEDFSDNTSDLTWGPDGTSAGNLGINNGKLQYAVNQNHRDLLTAPDSFATDVFTISGDLNIASGVGGEQYTRIMFRPFKGNNNYQVVFHLQNNSNYIQFMINDGNNFAGTKLSDVGKYIGTDTQFQMTRRGTALTFSIWVKGQYDTTVQTISYEISQEANASTYAAQKSIPQIRFQTDNRTINYHPVITMDNIYLENTVGKVNVVGAQASVETANDTNDGRFAVRFVATIDSLDYEKAGFVIKAVTANGTEKNWTLDTCTAYTAILGSTDTGTIEYTAQELGGKYLIALTVNNIPKSAGSVAFEVTAFCQNSSNTFTSDMGTIDAVVQANNTVVLS